VDAMKVYFYENGMTMVGKAWQIKAKLREYRQSLDSLHELLQKNERAIGRPKLMISNKDSLTILSRVK
jgi:hypothetical protein